MFDTAIASCLLPEASPINIEDDTNEMGWILKWLSSQIVKMVLPFYLPIKWFLQRNTKLVTSLSIFIWARNRRKDGQFGLLFAFIHQLFQHPMLSPVLRQVLSGTFGGTTLSALSINISSTTSNYLSSSISNFTTSSLYAPSSSLSVTAFPGISSNSRSSESGSTKSRSNIPNLRLIYPLSW